MPISHTDKAFEAELTELRGRLLDMGTRVETLIGDSIRALVERDDALAERVTQEDRAVNRQELEVDGLCTRLLALRQPAASDLRLITTALKIVTDLERIGDLAVNVAQRVRELNQVPPLAQYVDLPRLAELAQRQVKAALEAFVSEDAVRAREVLGGDELIDALFLKLFNELVAYMMEDSKNIRRATALMFIAKHLERVADHAMNVAEMVVYMVQGTDIRHPGSRGLRT